MPAAAQMYCYSKDELITIVPNFSLPTENGTCECISVRAAAERALDCKMALPSSCSLHSAGKGLGPNACVTATCVQGVFGPFIPNQECEVPIWMAHTLWKRKKCTIKAPDWLNAAHLEGGWLRVGDVVHLVPAAATIWSTR